MPASRISTEIGTSPPSRQRQVPHGPARSGTLLRRHMAGYYSAVDTIHQFRIVEPGSHQCALRHIHLTDQARDHSQPSFPARVRLASREPNITLPRGRIRAWLTFVPPGCTKTSHILFEQALRPYGVTWMIKITFRSNMALDFICYGCFIGFKY